MQKYALLEPYCDEEDLKYYRTLYLNYYGSEALHYNQDYFGDSFFLLADRLLQNANEHSDAILNIISDEHNGFGLYEFENNCFPSYDITATIEALKERIEARRFINSEQMSEAKSFIEKIKAKFFTKAPKADPQSSSVEILGNTYKVQKAEDMSELEFLCKTITLQNLSKDIKHSFAEFNIAFYFGSLAHKETLKDADSLLSCVGANSVTFSLSTKSCGFNILSSAPQIAYKKAGAILLDAQDSNVDILVVDSKEAMKMLNSNLKKCEEAMGREIDIQIITPSQLVAIATGTTEKKALGFDKKGSKITFI
jgi:hypothetical protein